MKVGIFEVLMQCAWGWYSASTC